MLSFHGSLGILQERCSLAVTSCSFTWFLLAKDGWNSDEERTEENYRHDGESKDPLKGESLGSELPNSQSGHQEGRCESDLVVTEDQ